MTKWTKITMTSASAFAVAAAGIGGAAAASESATPAPFGTSQKLIDGISVSEYMVENLQPSNDMVNVPINGQLRDRGHHHSRRGAGPGHAGHPVERPGRQRSELPGALPGSRA